VQSGSALVLIPEQDHPILSLPARRRTEYCTVPRTTTGYVVHYLGRPLSARAPFQKVAGHDATLLMERAFYGDSLPGSLIIVPRPPRLEAFLLYPTTIGLLRRFPVKDGQRRARRGRRDPPQ
jgi:hypothetical protein